MTALVQARTKIGTGCSQLLVVAILVEIKVWILIVENQAGGYCLVERPKTPKALSLLGGLGSDATASASGDLD